MIFPEFSSTIVPRSTYFLLGNIMFFYEYDEFVGRKFGKWIIKSHEYLKGKTYFVCECECGRKSTIQSSTLINGRSIACKSCAARKHGLYKTSTNSSWASARNRCNNPNNKDYADYGGRGIKFCEKWKDFRLFLEDMGEKPDGLTLDRIDNDGNYEPGNCRWATKSQQNSNQRKRYGKAIK